MASYSDALLLALLAQGESSVLGFDNWGDAAVSNFQFLEDALTQKSDITVTTADVTLNAAQNRHLHLNITGTLTGNRNVIVADRRGFWLVYNNTAGAFSLTFKTAAGSGVVVQQGKRAILYCDGTDVTDFLAIGTNVQAYDAGLQSIAGLTTAADRMIYTTASDTYAVSALTAYARTLLDDADASTALSTLGFSTFAKTIIDDADAATMRATIGANSATNLTTGTVNKDRLPNFLNATIFDADVIIRDSGNRRILFQNDDPAVKAIIYSDSSTNDLRLQLYNGFGTLQVELRLNQDGTIFWNSSPVMTRINSIYTGSSSVNTDYPIGSYLMCAAGASPAPLSLINAAVVPRLDAGSNNTGFTVGGAGTLLLGNWLNRGTTIDSSGIHKLLIQRIS